MLSDRNKQLAKNVGKSTGNYLIIFVVMVVLIHSTIGWIAGGWPEFIKLMLMSRESTDYKIMKWVMAIWTALYFCAYWFFVNIIIRAYKRQKEIKWG